MTSISGVWKFNDVITEPQYCDFGGGLGTQIIANAIFNFTNKQWSDKLCDRIIYSRMAAVNVAPTSSLTVGYYNDSNSGLNIGYEFDKNYWRYGVATLDFGETPQEVTDDFYAWFTTNAKRVITKKFAQLYKGETITTGGVYSFRRLSKEEFSEEEKPYLTFSSTAPFTLGVANAKKNWDGTLEYSTDANTWNVWNGTTTLSADNGKMYLRGTGNTKITGVDAYEKRLVYNGETVVCEGNIENILDYKTVLRGDHPRMADYCYSCMFNGWGELTKSPLLPATTLTPYCYSSMFAQCFYLVKPPALPATTLADYCYAFMFHTCTRLYYLPLLPATTLADYCYKGMFYRCTSITVSDTKTNDNYIPYRIPSNGTGVSGLNSCKEMFAGTTGIFSSVTNGISANINTVYYMGIGGIV